MNFQTHELARIAVRCDVKIWKRLHFINDKRDIFPFFMIAFQAYLAIRILSAVLLVLNTVNNKQSCSDEA